MAITCQIKCQGKITSLNIQRPKLSRIIGRYDDITNISDTVSLKTDFLETFRQFLYHKSKYATMKDKEKQINNILEQESKKVDRDMYKSALKYAKVGGKPLEEYIRWRYAKNIGERYEDMSNSCALRVSYALNYDSDPIEKSMTKQIDNKKRIGKDGHIYYLGVYDIINLLNANWKDLTWKKSVLFESVKQEIENGDAKDFIKTMSGISDNKKFFCVLQSICRNGIVALTNTSGFRHTTLWNGGNFADNTNWLDGNVFIETFYFWQLS